MGTSPVLEQLLFFTPCLVSVCLSSYRLIWDRWLLFAGHLALRYISHVAVR